MTVTGNVTNIADLDIGYPVVFVLVTDPDNTAADPLIRKITVTVPSTDPDTGDPIFIDEIIEKVIP